ncbi:protein LUTEIN DEFICIENT 5 chloroplastic isoform X1 [Tripterygium wilfordii]|uniref:Protein LUTEIN DEFICIENT 5 chloroplastic isoform X1 n=1 Tax=Tripterygium wilfordii TaxID=458696 RepID=A0A7J7CDH4_TRIWF|nr:protein LUTEIN DEFICIENT 5 chloroplastic isoform X1 [Tripterygium wilfordii]
MAVRIPLFQVPPSIAAPPQRFSTKLHTSGLKSSKSNGFSMFAVQCAFVVCIGFCIVTCSASNGREPDSIDDSVKSVDQVREEKRHAQLSARIASGEFTARQSGFPSQLRNGLSKLGISHELLGFLFKWIETTENYPKIPEAKGQISAICSEAFFIPLYELYLTYGGIFIQVEFWTKGLCLLICCCYLFLALFQAEDDEGILAEILDFVMGKGLIPADGEIWCVRRPAIVPSIASNGLSEIRAAEAALFFMFSPVLTASSTPC